MEITGHSKKEVEDTCYKLYSKGIIWTERQGFKGYFDVHQIILKSFLEVEPSRKLKEYLSVSFN
ncbi:MAG: hypothetical protein P8Y97_11845 [Candidatus Lokiarchaeota archaeon]